MPAHSTYRLLFPTRTTPSGTPGAGRAGGAGPEPRPGQATLSPLGAPGPWRRARQQDDAQGHQPCHRIHNPGLSRGGGEQAVESRAKPAFWGGGQAGGECVRRCLPTKAGVSRAHSVEEEAGQRPQTDGGDASVGQNMYNRSGGATFIERRQQPTPPHGRLLPRASAVWTRRVREQLPGTRGRSGRRATSQSVPPHSPPSGAGGIYTHCHHRRPGHSVPQHMNSSP